MVAQGSARLPWIVLVYRVPREPSSPRIAIWRRLRSLGVAQLGDGVVALPEDARIREHLEWTADEVLAAGGTSLLLRAHTMTAADERSIATRMADARAEEYRAVAARASALTEELTRNAHPAGARARKKLQHDLRAVTRRDYFPPPERDLAAAAVADLMAMTHGRRLDEPGPTSRPRVGGTRQ